MEKVFNYHFDFFSTNRASLFVVFQFFCTSNAAYLMPCCPMYETCISRFCQTNDTQVSRQNLGKCPSNLFLSLVLFFVLFLILFVVIFLIILLFHLLFFPLCILTCHHIFYILNFLRPSNLPIAKGLLKCTFCNQMLQQKTVMKFVSLVQLGVKFCQCEISRLCRREPVYMEKSCPG